jgi:hypothetical protein
MGAAIEGHRRLGPGWLEGEYEIAQRSNGGKWVSRSGSKSLFRLSNATFSLIADTVLTCLWKTLCWWKSKPSANWLRSVTRSCSGISGVQETSWMLITFDVRVLKNGWHEDGECFSDSALSTDAAMSKDRIR